MKFLKRFTLASIATTIIITTLYLQNPIQITLLLTLIPLLQEIKTAIKNNKLTIKQLPKLYIAGLARYSIITIGTLALILPGLIAYTRTIDYMDKHYQQNQTIGQALFQTTLNKQNTQTLPQILTGTTLLITTLLLNQTTTTLTTEITTNGIEKLPIFFIFTTPILSILTITATTLILFPNTPPHHQNHNHPSSNQPHNQTQNQNYVDLSPPQ